MKSVVENKDKEAELNFPCLMTSRPSPDFGDIVLFSKPNVGTVVGRFEARTTNPIGYFSKAWYMDYFTPFNGAVTLSND